MPLTTKMITFHVPEDPAFLAAFARASICHAHLDYALRMCIKTLADASIFDAPDATEREGSGVLRDRIRKLGRMRLGEGKPLLQLQAIMKRCADATDRRNRLTHDIVAVDETGAQLTRGPDHTWHPLPKPEELDALASTLSTLAGELNHARLHGWLAAALEQSPLARSR